MWSVLYHYQAFLAMAKESVLRNRPVIWNTFHEEIHLRSCLVLGAFCFHYLSWYDFVRHSCHYQGERDMSPRMCQYCCSPFHFLFSPREICLVWSSSGLITCPIPLSVFLDQFIKLSFSPLLRAGCPS